MAKASSSGQTVQQEIYEGIHKNASRQASQTTSAEDSISILMTGKTGSGKSTLVNGILGLKIADEGGSLERCTTKVQKYEQKKNGINVTVWDSPGLQDGTIYQKDYLKEMKTHCSQVDLTMYCIRVTEARLVRGSDNPDVVAMQKLTETFGVDFWENTIIVLTYANTLEKFNVEWGDLSMKEKAEAFNAKIKEWEEQIKEIMTKDISVPKRVVDGIKVVPTGHYRKQHLLGVQFWLSSLWFKFIEKTQRVEAKVALVKINENRIKREDEVAEDDFKKELQEQPIVATKLNVAKMAALGSASGLAAGAGIGALVGGLVGGPIGLGIGVGIGVAAGLVSGGSVFGGFAALKNKFFN